MRHLSTLAVTLWSLAIGFAVAWATYRHAWQIPVVQNLRGAQLFCALWILATPLATIVALLARVTTWRKAAKSGALFLALAVPAFGITSSFDRIRNASRDKAILCNLRQLAAAADQYFLENGATEVRRFEDLVGPQRYIKAINAVAGEDYLENFPFRQGGVLSAVYPSTKILNYNTGDDFPGYKHIFLPGETPPWRKARRGTDGATLVPVQPGSSAVATAGPSPSAAFLTRFLGIPSNPHRQNLTCSRCHPR